MSGHSDAAPSQETQGQAKSAAITRAHSFAFKGELQQLIHRSELRNGCQLDDKQIADYLVTCFTALCNARPRSEPQGGHMSGLLEDHT